MFFVYTFCIRFLCVYMKFWAVNVGIYRPFKNKIGVYYEYIPKGVKTLK